MWEIDRRTGLPDTQDPLWSYDQTNVDFWHSATFSWDGKIANFIDESFGDGCPTVTTKTGGLSGGPREFQTGNMYFFATRSGRLLSEYRNPRPTNDNVSPTTGKYCSSHLGIPVPARDRYLLVNAFYRGGSSVIDFTDPTRPREIAFADLDGTNTWSAYTYPRKSGRRSTLPVYSNDGLSRNYAAPRQPELPGDRLRLHALRGARAVEPRRLQPPEPAAAGAGHRDEVRPQVGPPRQAADLQEGQGGRQRRGQPLRAALEQVERQAEGPRRRALRFSLRPDQSVIVVPTVLMTKASGNRAARRCTALHPVQ